MHKFASDILKAKNCHKMKMPNRLKGRRQIIIIYIMVGLVFLYWD